MWSGSISFGLINIPVRLQPAIREKRVRFHLFSNDKGHCKVRQKLICESTHKEVSRDDVVKGYELEKGRFVMMDEDEIAKLAPKATKEISLLQFIDLKEIDPVFYSKAYYLLPEKNGKKAYFLLKEALKNSNKIGIAQFVMKNRKYLAALRVYQDALCLETMHYNDEILTPPAISKNEIDLSPREIETAEKLIDSLTEKFHAEKFHDDYRELLLEVIRKKKIVKTTGSEGHPSEKKEAEVVDLIAALEASLKSSKKKVA